MSLKKIAVVGASGNLGPSIVEKLLAADFDLTILSQSKSSNATSNPKIIQVDYSSQESITSALRGHDALVSLVPNHDSQPALIDAAIAAGVKRFIPSEFGSDVVGNAKTAALPVFHGKLLTEKYLQEKSGQIEWTLIMTSVFLDFALAFGLGINLKGDSPVTQIYDGGDVRVSMTRMSAVGDAVVGVLRNPDATRDRSVYVQEAAFTQNQLIAYAEKRKPGLKMQREDVTVGEVLQKADADLKSGDKGRIMPAMIGFIIVSLFDPAYGALWEGKNDNELLGLKPITDAEVEEEVAKYL